MRSRTAAVVGNRCRAGQHVVSVYYELAKACERGDLPMVRLLVEELGASIEGALPTS